MRKLEQFDNLINAMGALFYASKRMQTQVPCVFQSWKDHVFERRAGKIHELISSGNNSLTSPNKSELKSFSGTLLSRGAVGPQVLIADTISPLSGVPSPDMHRLTSFNHNQSNTEHMQSANYQSGSKISNSGVTEAEKDYDEYFDHGEVEEYINVRDSDQSCHILPLSNTKYNSGDSQFEDDEVESVIEEEEDADDMNRDG